MRALRTFSLALIATTIVWTAPVAAGQSDAAAEPAAAAPGPPAIALAGRVTDAAHILTTAQRHRLAAKLEGLERATRHQLVVVTAPSLGGQEASVFTKDLANSWGVGRKGINDGVVLLVAPHERKARIAVGLGLDKELPDAVCQQIMDEKMLPHFKAGDLPGGIEAGVDALIAKLK